MTNQHSLRARLAWAGAVVIIGLLSGGPAAAQLTGRVDVAELGLSFMVPEQWVGQFTEDAFVMGGLQEPGLILIMPHEYDSLDEMRREAQQGISEGATMLRLDGSLEPIGDHALGGAFRGSLEGSPARVYLVAAINPHGLGMSVMAVGDDAADAARLRALAREVAASLTFSKVEAGEVVEQARQLLANHRLTYLESYSSGASGGYSVRRSLDLCPGDRFYYQDGSSVSADVGGVFGSAHGSGRGAGTWAVVPRGGQALALELRFDDGRVVTYALAFKDGKTYLDGERYFRIGAGDPNGNGPRCD